MIVETILTNITGELQSYGWVKKGGLRLFPGQSVTLDGDVYTMNKGFPGNQRRIATDIKSGRIGCTLKVTGAAVQQVPYDSVVEAIPAELAAPQPDPVPVVEPVKDVATDLKAPSVDFVTGEEVKVEKPTDVSEVFGFINADDVKTELRLSKYTDVKALAAALGNTNAKNVISKEEAIKWIAENGDLRKWVVARDQDAVALGTVELVRKALEFASNKI